MAWLPGLRRSLHPAKKLLKAIRSKLHTKLHSVNKSKISKKPKNPNSPFKSNRHRHHQKNRLNQLHAVLPHHHNRLLYHPDSPPSIDAIAAKICPPSGNNTIAAFHRTCGGSEVEAAAALHLDVGQRRDETGMGEKGGGVAVEGAAADEPWEFVAMASPMMRGIDERAEEFIARFKAELKSQQRSGETGMGEKGGGVAVEAAAADDPWESVAMASPMMRGVDERAEEFIAKFKAELKSQQMIDRRL
ncbi:hypothetical protein Dimus_032413 [Dionaea muscipula]